MTTRETLTRAAGAVAVSIAAHACFSTREMMNARTEDMTNRLHSSCGNKPPDVRVEKECTANLRDAQLLFAECKREYPNRQSCEDQEKLLMTAQFDDFWRVRFEEFQRPCFDGRDGASCYEFFLRAQRLAGDHHNEAGARWDDGTMKTFDEQSRAVCDIACRQGYNKCCEFLSIANQADAMTVSAMRRGAAAAECRDVFRQRLGVCLERAVTRDEQNACVSDARLGVASCQSVTGP